MMVSGAIVEGVLMALVDGTTVERVTDDSVDGASHLGGWSDG